MPVTLTDDPSQFPAQTAPVNSDAFSVVRQAFQKAANRVAHVKSRLDEGVPRVRVGTAEQMAAINVATLSTGDVFAVPGQGAYFFDSASVVSAAAPWVYAPLVGAGRWVHEFNALRTAPEGIPFMTAGRVADGLVKHGIISMPFWWSSALNQTINGGVTADLTGAAIALGALAAGDVVEVDVNFGDIQAVGINSVLSVRITDGVTPQDLPGLGALKIPQRAVANAAGTVSGMGRFTVGSPASYTITARVTAGSSSDVTVTGNGVLRARVFRP